MLQMNTLSTLVYFKLYFILSWLHDGFILCCYPLWPFIAVTFYKLTNTEILHLCNYLYYFLGLKICGTSLNLSDVRHTLNLLSIADYLFLHDCFYFYFFFISGYNYRFYLAFGQDCVYTKAYLVCIVSFF